MARPYGATKELLKSTKLLSGRCNRQQPHPHQRADPGWYAVLRVNLITSTSASISLLPLQPDQKKSSYCSQRHIGAVNKNSNLPLIPSMKIIEPNFFLTNIYCGWTLWKKVSGVTKGWIAVDGTIDICSKLRYKWVFIVSQWIRGRHVR